MEQTESSNEAAVAAAEWWARAIGAPSYDNGEPVHGLLASMAFAGSAATPAASTTFAAELTKRILADFEQQATWRESGPYVTLGVDYGPGLMLAEAAAAAQVSSNAFPWKTKMWVYPEYVTVSAGYAAPTRLVWASEAWLADRPVCGAQLWDEAKGGRDYHGDPWACSSPKYHEEAHEYDVPLTLCGVCGRTDGWYHEADQRGHMPDFHTFAAPVVTP